jgi:hypothetical protein
MAILSLSELKTHLNITGTSEDQILNPIINGVNEEIKQQCGEIETDTFTETVRFTAGMGFTKNRPITAITSLLDEYSTSYEYYDNELLDAGVIQLKATVNVLLTVTYTAGYSSVPGDVKLYALRLGEYYYYKKPGVVSESMEGFSTKYGMPDDTLISPYRRASL